MTALVLSVHCLVVGHKAQDPLVAVVVRHVIAMTNLPGDRDQRKALEPPLVLSSLPAHRLLQARLMRAFPFDLFPLLLLRLPQDTVHLLFEKRS